MTLQLPADIEQFIKDRIRSGEYASEQDVVCAGLRLLQARNPAQESDDFEPGEWDRLLAEADESQGVSLDEAIARRRAERRA